MPAVIFVKVISAVGLPVMDKTSDSTDAFVEVKLGDKQYRTDVLWKSLNPVFNSEVFRFELSDEEVAVETLHIKVMDHDTYSANDAIGKVSINLLPFMVVGGNNQLAGWLPLYDTMHGNRGYINLNVKVSRVGDIMQCQGFTYGFPIFTFNSIPSGSKLDYNYGMVSDVLVVNDTEDDWMDMLRPSRTSNEVRQRVFRSLSNEMTVILINKCFALGGNALLGLRIYFDIEGDSGIVCRGFGTCVTLSKTKAAASLGDVSLKCESDETTVNRSLCANLDKLKFLSVECPVLNIPIHTLKSLPSSMIYKVGGTVTAVSFRTLDSSEKYDARTRIRYWWDELRLELKRQAYILNCNYVGGYSESVSINGKHYVMFAHGTAISSMPTYGDTHKCTFCHIPYSVDKSPYGMVFQICQSCGKENVSECIISTMNLPPELPTSNNVQFIQVCSYRSRSVEGGISSGNQDLLVSTYILHKKIVKRLKLYGLNSLFNLSVDVCISETSIVYAATGWGYLIESLPSPKIPTNLRTLEHSSFIETSQKKNEISRNSEVKLECGLVNMDMLRPRHSFVISLFKMVKFANSGSEAFSEGSTLLQIERISAKNNFNRLRREIDDMLEYLYFKASRLHLVKICDIRMQITQDDDLFFLDLFCIGYSSFDTLGHSMRLPEITENLNSSRLEKMKNIQDKEMNECDPKEDKAVLEHLMSKNDVFVTSSSEFHHENVRHLGLLSLIHIRESNNIKRVFLFAVLYRDQNVI